MTESGDPKDNALAEHINNTMKKELLKDMRFSYIDEVIVAVDRAVSFYNHERPHMSIEMMMTAMAAACKGSSKSTISATVRRLSVRSGLWKSLKIVYLCPSFRDLPPAYGRQSTLERDKTWNNN